MSVFPMVKWLKNRWRLALVVGLVLVGLSLILLASSLLPSGDLTRIQVTLAPTLFVPPGGGP